MDSAFAVVLFFNWKSETTMNVNGPEKLLYLTLGIMFLALGVVGLLIPILPGVLFLAGAVYMLSRGSARVRRFAETHPGLRGLQARFDRLDSVPVISRVKVVSLMIVSTIVDGIAKLTRGVTRLFA